MNILKKLFTNVRILILIAFLLIAIVSIHPNPWHEGATIRFVTKDSAANLAGMEGPSSGSTPMGKETIIAINNKPVTSANDYYEFVADIPPNKTFTLQTNDNIYRLITKPEYKITILNETETQTITTEVFDEELNETINVTETIEVPIEEKEIIGTEDIGLVVYDAPTNNIRKGLDLSGGTRVVLEPEEQVSAEELDIVISNIKERLNIYGLSDITVRSTRDLTGDYFVVVEIAGANKEEVKELLAKQGKFEAKIGPEVVFKGGSDVTYVCRSADCSGIDPNSGCGTSPEGWACRFRFSIALSPEAAQRQADVSRNLEVVFEGTDDYLNESLDLFLDDILVDSLRIGAELRGSPVTDISISGSGAGATQQEATYDTLQNMKRLQTILITGSLPVKLNIVKTDSISPLLGEEFIKNALLMGLLAIVSVAIVVFIRYRKFSVSIPMFITMLSEALIILGMASIIGWNLDLAAIAGIIIAIGTGVDHQIVIADETLTRKTIAYLSWKDRIKSAFFIIMAAYFTTLVAMIPLYFAGAGLLKGFAITTILGVTAGVFITRPAFAAIVEIFNEN
jgi:preprotein translocase subunit SecD